MITQEQINAAAERRHAWETQRQPLSTFAWTHALRSRLNAPITNDPGAVNACRCRACRRGRDSPSTTGGRRAALDPAVS